jgi:hypothetical protein
VLANSASKKIVKETINPTSPSPATPSSYFAGSGTRKINKTN